MVFLFKVPKHKVTWSKRSILIIAVVLDPLPFKFAPGKGLSGFSNMFRQKLSERIQGNRYQHALSMLMTPERRFAEVYLDGVMQYCLPSNMKILISQAK